MFGRKKWCDERPPPLFKQFIRVLYTDTAREFDRISTKESRQENSQGIRQENTSLSMLVSSEQQSYFRCQLQI